MGSKSLLLAVETWGREKNFEAESTKLQWFANSSGQIRVLVKTTGIDLAKLRAAQLSASP